MKYYYDIYLNFYEYPLNFYEWQSNDDIERVLKIPTFRVEEIKDFINYNMSIECDYDRFIIADGINAIALELINGDVAYLSTINYEDENAINDLVRDVEITNFNITLKEKRNIPFELRQDAFIKKILLKRIEESSIDELKYIYYDVTLKESSNIAKIKEYLIEDIKNNFNQKYVNLYEKIYK